MPQSGSGRIEIFEDFIGAEWIIAETAASGAIGSLRVIGDGIAETDSGAINLESDGMSGVVQLTSTNEDKHGVYIATPVMFDVGLMGPLVLEARLRLPALANREVFIGFSDVNSDDLSLEDDLVHGGTATITLTASDLVGFLFSSELSDSEDWHTVYNGGTTTGQTASGSTDLNDDAVAGEFQVLRLELAPNGRVEWYIDGVLKQTVAGAVSTSVDLCLNVIVESKTTAVKTLDVDYIKVWANRDWTA